MMVQWIRRLVCLCIGHAWGWPELYFTVEPSPLTGTRCVFLRHVWRECLRCHARARDDERCTSSEVLPSFEGSVRGFREQDVFGEQVKRAMGWDR